MDHKLKSNQESNNLILDHKIDYGYQRFSWPQRNFTCDFCNKEYKSPQALGGHMNVHRKVRARLRLSSPSYLTLNSNPNPDTKYVPPPSPVRYLPYKSYLPSLLPLVSTANTKDGEKKVPMFACSGLDILGCTTDSMGMEDGEEENGIRVWKKNKIFNIEMEIGLLKDEKIELDLELRLGRS